MENTEISKNKPLKIKMKLCLLGDGAVGKTSLMEKFVNNTYREAYLPTIGTRTSKKSITVSDAHEQRTYNIEFYIWDIMGQISFRKILHPAYLKGARGALMICDLTRRETLENLDDWIDSLQSEWRSVPLVFVANKSDLHDSFEFGVRELERFASAFESHSFVTSAKTGNNIEQVFTALGRAILEEESILITDVLKTFDISI